MKLVQKSLIACASAICALLACLPAAAQNSSNPAYLAFYNPVTGFKPAQPNLTEIFLQIAGSLEYSGSPEAYLRHMQQEHARISRKFAAVTGQAQVNRMPAHMTPEYIDRMISNWNVLSPKLGLEALAKEVGRCAREGIRGTRGTGTLAVQIFNDQQKLVVQQMQSNEQQTAEFEQLRAKIEDELEFNKESVSLLGYETTRRDAVTYALVIRVTYERLFSKIDAALPPDRAAQIKSAIRGVFLDLGRMAQAELEIAILELAASQ